MKERDETTAQTTDAPPWVIPLQPDDDIEPDRHALGGKGARLAQLAHVGWSVPVGFCVTTTAFEHALTTLLETTSALDHIDARLRQMPLPSLLIDTLRRAFADHFDATTPLAVRSSMPDEDGHTHSFAGQQASVLNVRGFDAFLDALRTVWASLFTERALLYRNHQSLETPPTAMAVVVQHLVDAHVAGVLFTAHPVTRNQDQMMVCAAYGLGDTVVGGGDVDTFVLDRRSGQVLEQTLGDKRQALRPNDDGQLVATPVDPVHHQAPCLTTPQLDDLVALGRHVERFFGEPQDIEFAFSAEGTLHLLQARPITTPALPAITTTPAVYSNANVGEALPGVGSPMTWSLIRGFSRRGFETAFGALGLDVPDEYTLVASFRGRVYLNLSEFCSVASQIPLLTPELLVRLSGASGAEHIRSTLTKIRPWTFLRRLPTTIPRLVISQLTMPRTARQWRAHMQVARQTFFASDLSQCDRDELRRCLDELDTLFNKTGEVMLAASSNFLMSYVVVSTLLRWLGGPEAARKEGLLFSGLTQVSSAAPGLALLELARFVRDRPRLRAVFDEAVDGQRLDPTALFEGLAAISQGQIFIRRFERFMERWGHRAPLEADLATPRWREDAGFLFDVILGHLRAPRLPSAYDVERRQAQQRREATQLIRQHFMTGTGLLFQRLLLWAQNNARLREALRSEVVATLSMYRHLMLELGRRMAASDHVSDVDDVFFLTYGELRAWLEGDASSTTQHRFNVAYRRALHAAFANSPDPPDTFVLGQDQTIPTTDTPVHGGDVIVGLGGAPGQVTGRARVIESLDDAGRPIAAGEILVTSFTDVGWTPLFLIAAGVVTDRGGPLSHACVVAREYGLPAVVNTRIATQRIRTGDLVTVDGTHGRVFLASSSHT